MWSETRRPEYLDGVVGHTETKQAIRSYLATKPYNKVLLLHGPPGIGKTTMVLAATRTCEFDPLEVNASQSLRSFADVEQLMQSARHTRSILAFAQGHRKPVCLILDEVDGSDPHAQRKLSEWIKSEDRKIPILMTCNEVPRVFKMNETITKIRCYPPKPADLVALFPGKDVQLLARQFKHDVRRIFQCLQYGLSDTLPTITLPNDCTPEVLCVLKQKMSVEIDPIERAIAHGTPASH